VKYLLAILLAASLFVSGYTMGKKQLQPADYRLRVDTLVRESVRLDTLWREVRAKYDSAIIQYDTVRMLNTVVKNDTVYIPRPVADSIVFACRAVVNTCESQKANLTARLAVAEHTISERNTKRNIAVSIGVGAGVLIGLLLK
jgi:hypothetical protein